MMEVYNAYKFRLYPNTNQLELINRMFGCNRFIYNYYLDKMKNNGYNSVYLNISDYVNNLKYEYPFLQEVDSIIIRKSLFNLDTAFKKMFNEHTGYPKFKSKFSRNSYNTNAIYNRYYNKEYCNIELDLGNRMIKLPKLKWLKIRGYRNIDKISGRIKSATISKESNGKYYVSILYEISDKIIDKVKPRKVIGIDLGIKKLLTLSDGTSYDNNKYIEKYEKRIKRKQRELSRKIKGSKNYYKCKLELARLHSKLANSRKYYLHQITKYLTDEYDIISCETLSIKDMIVNGKKNHLSKSLNNTCFNQIIEMLKYKSLRKGKYFITINKYYPSSQICSRCDHQDNKYKNLGYRKYICRECGLKLDRDLNASINIMFEGIKQYMKILA